MVVFPPAESRASAALIVEYLPDGAGGEREPTFLSPERVCLGGEVVDIAAKVIRSEWGIDGVEYFTRWLFAEDLTEFAKAEGCSIESAEEKIAAMINHCRIAIGVEGGGKPTRRTEEGKRADARRSRVLERERENNYRQIANLSRPASLDDRIELSDEVRLMKLEDIRAFIQQTYGFTIALATASFARRRGWLMRPGWKQQAFGEGRVVIDKEHLDLPARKIAELYGISRNMSFTAKRRGYFWITENNRNKVRSALALLMSGS
jgi:hypothetical protein